MAAIVSTVYRFRLALFNIDRLVRLQINTSLAPRNQLAPALASTIVSIDLSATRYHRNTQYVDSASTVTQIVAAHNLPFTTHLFRVHVKLIHLAYQLIAAILRKFSVPRPSSVNCLGATRRTIAIIRYRHYRRGECQTITSSITFLITTTAHCIIPMWLMLELYWLKAYLPNLKREYLVPSYLSHRCLHWKISTSHPIMESWNIIKNAPLYNTDDIWNNISKDSSIT